MTIRPPIEIWAGVECTVNRVGDAYFDQLAATGHDVRDDDLERFAALGIRTIRYPLLWERTAAANDGPSRWEWCDRRMARLRTLGMSPIVGLLHHGSGPRFTSLVDPQFPLHFERYVTAVARRFPWVRRWIPINEPLTTARFSCLYGHWYPHERNDRQFARAIIGQCLAAARASAAIRSVVPTACIIQTEDLGRAFSTRLLAYQADFENERRWLTFDLLFGRVRRGHPMWDWLRRAGADLNDLAWLADHPCPPDVLGINHYLTSERFLDERLERYPPRWRGGNGQHRYADIEAVRVCADGPAGLRVLLREAWERYCIPMAITEAHLDCSRDEQLRWLTEVRDICEGVSAGGAPVVALTVWSLLGSFNWNELMTVPGDYYESGVFDVRGPRPRETRLADLVRKWTAGGSFDHPALDGAGWWRRPVRLLYPPVPQGTVVRSHRQPLRRPSRTIVVADATAVVRREFQRAAHLRDLALRFVSFADLDDTFRHSHEHKPWALVLAAKAGVPHRQIASFLVTVGAASRIARTAARHGCHVTLVSSQQVFGHVRRRPYRESDAPDPATDAGRVALAVERAVTEADPAALIVRTAPCFGDCRGATAIDIHNQFAADVEGGVACSLTYLPDLVRAVLDLAIDGERGTWHLANRGAIAFGDVLQLARGLRSIPSSEPPTAPAGESYCLETERGALLPRLETAFERAGYGSSLAPSRISVSR